MDERKLSIVQSWTKQRCLFSTTPEYLYCCAEVYYCPAPDSLPLSRASRRRAPQSRLRACIKRFMDIYLFNWSSPFSVLKKKMSCSQPALLLVHESVRLAEVIFLLGTENWEDQIHKTPCMIEIYLCPKSKNPTIWCAQVPGRLQEEGYHRFREPIVGCRARFQAFWKI